MTSASSILSISDTSDAPSWELLSNVDSSDKYHFGHSKMPNDEDFMDPNRNHIDAFPQAWEVVSDVDDDANFTTPISMMLNDDNYKVPVNKAAPKPHQNIWDGDNCVHQVIKQQAIANPDAPAISAWDGDLTNSELNKLSSKLANHLVDIGVEPNMFVSVCFEKSVWAVISTLAILKAGGIFVPMDTCSPNNLLNTKFILTSQNHASSLQGFAEKIVIVSPHFMNFLDDRCVDPQAPLVPQNSACALFIPGSTEKWEIFNQTHFDVTSKALHCAQKWSIGSTSRVLQFAPATSITGNSDMFVTLQSGACLCIPRDGELDYKSILAVMKEMKVTFAALPEALTDRLAQEDLPSLVMMVGTKDLTDGVPSKWATGVDKENWNDNEGQHSLGKCTEQMDLEPSIIDMSERFEMNAPVATSTRTPSAMGENAHVIILDSNSEPFDMNASAKLTSYDDSPVGESFDNNEHDSLVKASDMNLPVGGLTCTLPTLEGISDLITGSFGMNRQLQTSTRSNTVPDDIDERARQMYSGSENAAKSSIFNMNLPFETFTGTSSRKNFKPKEYSSRYFNHAFDLQPTTCERTSGLRNKKVLTKSTCTAEPFNMNFPYKMPTCMTSAGEMISANISRRGCEAISDDFNMNTFCDLAKESNAEFDFTAGAFTTLDRVAEHFDFTPPCKAPVSMKTVALNENRHTEFQRTSTPHDMNTPSATSTCTISEMERGCLEIRKVMQTIFNMNLPFDTPTCSKAAPDMVKEIIQARQLTPAVALKSFDMNAPFRVPTRSCATYEVNEWTMAVGMLV